MGVSVRMAGAEVRLGETRLRFPDLDLGPGEELVVLGPSGSGKTTLLYLLAGLLRPQNGEVWVGGSALHRMGEKERDVYRRRTVGLVFQEFHLLPGYTAWEQVVLGLALSGVRGKAAWDRARDLLVRLGLGTKLHRWPNALSTGEKQRVALARAVAHGPGLLLADEPTAHLDRMRAQEALEVLVEVSRMTGATLVVTSHDPLVYERFARRLSLEG